MIDVSVIVISYNVRDLLRRCLTALVDGELSRSFEVLVVDNGSDDGTVQVVRGDFPTVTVITNGTNRGFTAANNQALAHARGENVLFLNPDAELLPGALDAMLAYLDAYPDVGIVGPSLSYPDGRAQPSRRRFPTPITALVESTLVQRWWPGCPVLDRYYMADRSADDAQDADWLVGACLLARHAAVEAIGGFDERFFMYSEELDLCRRIRQEGWRVVYVPDARVIHHEGRSSEQNLARRAQTFNESKCLYFEKNFGPALGRALRLALLANTTVELAIEASKLAVGHRPGLRRQRIGNLTRVVSYQWQRLGGGPCASR